jgi:hypothetical protein
VLLDLDFVPPGHHDSWPDAYRSATDRRSEGERWARELQEFDDVE